MWSNLFGSGASYYVIDLGNFAYRDVICCSLYK